MKRFLAVFRAIQITASLIVSLAVTVLYVLDKVDFDRVWRTATIMIIFGLLDHKNIQIAVSLLKHIGNFKTPSDDGSQA